jgi:hypothetical protein
MFSKHSVVCKPRVTNRDANTPIIFIAVVVSVSTSLYHICPCGIFRGPLTSTSISVCEVSNCLSIEAAATFGVTSHNVTSTDNRGIPTFAQAFPGGFVAFRSANTPNNGKAPENLAS